MIPNHTIKSFLKVFLIVSLMFFGCNTNAGTVDKAPDFKLSDLEGNEVSLSQYKGKVVILDFWATWCPPCQGSIPELVNLQNKYLEEGLVILGISTDDPRQTNNEYLLSFKKKFRINYTILRVTKKMMRDYFGNRSMPLPTLLIVNREGFIVEKHTGFRPGVVEKSLETIFK